MFFITARKGKRGRQPVMERTLARAGTVGETPLVVLLPKGGGQPALTPICANLRDWASRCGTRSRAGP